MRLAAAQARRKGVASVLGSSLLRWRYGAPIAEALALVPQELRPADPSFADEIGGGMMGLAGTFAHIGPRSPFAVKAPSPAWERELHGFGWLRHLAAAGSADDTERAREFVRSWIEAGSGRPDSANEPAVTGRRIMSWIFNAALLLEGVDQSTFDRTAESLVDQLIDLSAAWSSAADGYPRLEALIGVVYGDLCILGHEQHLAVSEAALAAELSRQFLPDGAHVSRNPEIGLRLLLDLLPLQKCFQRRHRATPWHFDAAIERMMDMLQFMRLGDGAIARFNGVGAIQLAELSRVLTYCNQRQHLSAEITKSGYARLERAGVILIADVGEAPPIELAGQANAGALSFEMSAGGCAILVNCGAPRPADRRHAATARATASHNALCLGDHSTARLLRDERLERMIGGMPIRSLGRVSAWLDTDGDTDVLFGTDEAYVGEHGLVHSRSIALAHDGSRVAGRDRLEGRNLAMRLARDAPFALHFHLHPKVQVSAGTTGEMVLTLQDGARWAFRAEGADMSLEPSHHFADPIGVVASLQIVLRGATWGESEIGWELVRSP